MRKQLYLNFAERTVREDIRDKFRRERSEARRVLRLNPHADLDAAARGLAWGGNVLRTVGRA